MLKVRSTPTISEWMAGSAYSRTNLDVGLFTHQCHKILQVKTLHQYYLMSSWKEKRRGEGNGFCGQRKKSWHTCSNTVFFTITRELSAIYSLARLWMLSSLCLTSQRCTFNLVQKILPYRSHIIFVLLEGACTSFLLLKNPICCSTERKYVRCICG